MAKIKLDALQCERCRHKWLPVDAAKAPKVCPKCKSPYWDRPRKASDHGRRLGEPKAAKAGEPAADRRGASVPHRGNARAR